MFISEILRFPNLKDTLTNIGLALISRFMDRSINFYKTDWVLAAGLFIASYSVLGFHYGWVDDIRATNALRGIHSSGAFSNIFEPFRGLSMILAWLYSIAPKVDWYSLFLYGCLYWSTVIIFLFLKKTLKSAGASDKTVVAVQVVFFLTVWIEHVYLLNFTKVAILSMGSSLLYAGLILTHRRSVQLVQVFGLGVLFLLGYLIRPEVAPFPVFIGLSYALVLSMRGRAFAKRVMAVGFFVFSVFCVHQVLEKWSITPDQEKHDVKWKHVVNLLDGHNFQSIGPLFETPADSIRLRSFQLWYFADDDQIDVAFLNRIGGDSPFSMATLARWRLNLWDEYHKIEGRKEGFQSGLGLLTKFYILTALNLLFMLILIVSAFFRKRSTCVELTSVMVNVGFFGLVLCVAVFLKYEDRVFTPSAAILLLANISLLFTESGLSVPSLGRPWWVSLGILVLLPIVGNAARNLGIAKERHGEVAKKQMFVRELNAEFENTVFLYDLWSITLLHDTPFRPVFLKPTNIHTCYGEAPFNDVAFHMEYLRREVCDFNSFIGFYDCIAETDRSVVFVLFEMRADQMNGYFQLLYNRNYQLVPVSENSSIHQIESSFLWDRTRFGLYELQQCQR